MNASAWENPTVQPLKIESASTDFSERGLGNSLSWLL
jgi:hypothetical protein